MCSNSAHSQRKSNRKVYNALTFTEVEEGKYNALFANLKNLLKAKKT